MIPDITIKELETISMYGLVTGDFMFEMDELQDATIANTQETTDITGKGGRKLSKLKKNKAVVVSGNHGLISHGLLEMQTGSKFKEVDKAPVKWQDPQTIIGNSATTEFVAVGTEGNEISEILIKDEYGVVVEHLKQDATASAGKFAYNPSTKVITFAEGAYPDGTDIIAIYMRNIKASVLENNDDSFSTMGRMYINGFGEDKCGKTYRIQFYIPKADMNGNFDIKMGSDQAVHAFEAESLTGSGCKALGGAGNLWTYTIFGVDAEDAA